MFTYDRDIRIKGAGLWLDAGRKKDFAFVSHAHSDHVARHESVLATPATLALAAERRRLRSVGVTRRSKKESELIPLEFGRPFTVKDATVTLFPAGHILGSAQILIERDGRRLLYSGDFCPEKTAAAEDIEIPRADTLIMECTYGHPDHRFPSRTLSVRRLCAFVEDTIASGGVPVVFSYALGKGQEVLRIISRSGYPAVVEEETFHLAKVYESFGVSFGQYRLLDSHVEPGEVVVTPNLKKTAGFLRGVRVRTASVTGWAGGPLAYRAARANVQISLSDHADFDGLLGYAAKVEPEVVYAVHGPADFAQHLAQAGFNVGNLNEKGGA